MDLVSEIERTLDRLKQGQGLANWQSLVEVCDVGLLQEHETVKGFLTKKYCRKIEDYSLIKMISRWGIPVHLYIIDTKECNYSAFLYHKEIKKGQIRNKSTRKRETYWPSSK